MMFLSRTIRLTFWLTVIAGMLLLLSAPVYAQCSMCRAVLSGSSNGAFVRNFNVGVLVLLVPPVTIFCSIFVVLRRYRREVEDPGIGPVESERRFTGERADG